MRSAEARISAGELHRLYGGKEGPGLSGHFAEEE